MTTARALILSAIRLYQRHLSPHKGFCCAYRVHTGRKSCSNLGYRAVRRYGALTGLAVLRRRLYLCGVAHRRYSEPLRRPHRKQRGDCDPGCDLPCDCNYDLSCDKRCSRAGDFLDCTDCCDWPDRKKKNQDEEKTVYIPPRVSRRSNE